MNNWRLLLFAVLCIFQPISSEENIFNGRERCHQQRSDSSRKDTRISPYEHLTTPSSEIRRINTRKEIREIPEQRVTEQDFSRTRLQFTSHREGISQDVRETNRRIRTNDRVSVVSRQGYDAETVSQRSERRSLSRNDRTQIRNIREERRTDTDNLIRDRRITSKQETNARSFRSVEINDKDRRTHDREVSRARITSSRNAESSNVPTRRNFVQREYENVQRRSEQNARLERNVNKILEQREFLQIDDDESRNLKRELKAIRVNANDRMNLEASRRNTERIVPRNLRDIRQNQGTNVIDHAIRTNSVNTYSHRSADVIDNRRNDIRRSITEFRRQDTDRKVRNDVRLELETRVRRDVDTDRRNNRDEQIRKNKVDVRDATVSFVRREESPSLRTNLRDSRTENRGRELNRALVNRSQRRLSLERHNRISGEFTSRYTQVKNSDFNRFINKRIRLVPIKQTDDNDRRETNILRQRNLDGFRNTKQDNRQRNTLDNSQRLDSMSSRFRQNVERDNGQRHRSIEAIRITRDDTMRENIRRSITLNDRFSNKMVRDESTRLYRTNEFSTETRSVTSENYFTFELQYLFYIIQAAYLISIFLKLPQNKQGLEKKSWFGSWKPPIVMKMD